MTTTSTAEPRKSVAPLTYSFSDLKTLLGLGRDGVELLMSRPDFPADIALGTLRSNGKPSKRFWLRADVHAWIDAQAAAAGTSEPAAQGRQQAAMCR
ncbi:putative DNA-binding transcriptional regulator AlpA [Metapseudomonas resinovorans]|uniref:helix-turn-helix transcriptional regulator n=1 Tax=Metapseudomonas resinovorans TaxID=53412 RepID=UPI003D216D7C